MSFTSTFNSLSVRGWQNPGGTSDRYYTVQNTVAGPTTGTPTGFGFAVSVSNSASAFAVGAPDKDSSNGQIYIIDSSFPSLIGNLVGSTDSLLGTTIDITSDANYVIAGAPGLSIQGYANIYVLDNTNNYVVQQKLNGGNIGDFGRQVAIADTNDLVAVQDFNDTAGNVTLAGSVRVFTRSGNTWTQQAKLIANDSSNGENFGSSLSINGNATCIAIGADNDNNQTGAAYIFTGSGNTWTQQAKITASDGANNDNFGRSIAITSDASHVVIGAPDAGTGNPGAAYVYSNVANTWTEIAKLEPNSSVITSFQAFGNEVEISDDARTIVISDFAAQISGQTVGSVYVFNRTVGNTYVQTQEIVNPNITSANNTVFGQSISLSTNGSLLAIGNPNWENPGNSYLSQGLVYLYKSF